MKINISVKLPRTDDEETVKRYLSVFGREQVIAYSLNDDFTIKEGKGCVKNNGMYNYHNNYDDSEDELFFDGRQRYWTPSLEKIENLRKENVENAISIIENKKQELIALLK